MKYYVGSIAEDSADAVWKVAPPHPTQSSGNTSGNSPEKTDQNEDAKKANTP